MPYRLTLPDLGEGVAEGEIVQWLVTPGEVVEEDQPLLEVLTDKAQVEVPSPVAGRVLATYGEPSTVVPVGAVLVEIETDDGAAAGLDASAGEPSDQAPSPTPAGAEPTAPGALPAVRRLASSLGVDVGAIEGTGPGGRVTEEDVRAAAGQGPDAGGVPLAGVRRTIARRLTEAAAVPTVTAVDAADFTPVRAAGTPPLAATAFAVAQSLREQPVLNAWFRDGRVICHEHVHLGIATETPEGLLVPVVRDADTMDLDVLAAAVDAVSGAAREGRLDPADLAGSTVTLTSAGRTAGEFATPLLNLPEVAILGLYRIEPRPVVRDGEVVIRDVGNLSVTFDHRVADGRDAARLLQRVIELIETTDWAGEPAAGGDRS